MRNQRYGDGNPTMKGKRKDFDLDDVSYDLSDFSLTSLARKTRRLDAELAPIIEEEEADIPLIFQHSQPGVNLGSSARRGVVIEELPSGLENEERAIVLFNPINTPLGRSPTNFSISVSPKFVSSFKNDALWSNQSNQWGSSIREDDGQEKNPGAAKECLAVVPWVPSQLSYTTGNGTALPTDISGMMGAEEMDVETMDVEDEGSGFNQGTDVNMSSGLPHWQQQQHCLIPQPLQNTSTPIVWFR